MADWRVMWESDEFSFLRLFFFVLCDRTDGRTTHEHLCSSKLQPMPGRWDSQLIYFPIRIPSAGEVQVLNQPR